jgi:hypothetical protein
VPYKWGGTDPSSGLDCSGFVQRVYADLGINLPRVSYQQAKVGQPVASLAQAQPGDILAFGSPVDHVGIYVGNGMMMAAPHTGDVVKIQPVLRNITSIRRIVGTDAAATSSYAAAYSGRPTAPSAYDGLFQAAGAKYGLSPQLLKAVATVESGLRPDAVSGAGAEGLMQIMPGTAAGMGVDPFDPTQAVDGAARILSSNLQQFGSMDLALAAYNAGAGAVSRAGGVPSAQVQAYVSRVLSLAGAST